MTFTDLALVLIVFILVLTIFTAVEYSERRLGASAEVKRKKLWAVGIGLALWLAISGLAAQEGLLLDYDSFPPPAARVLFPSLVLVLAIVFSPVGERLANGLTYPQLIGYQMFRLPVELVLLAYYYAGRIPVDMTFEGRNYDVVTALTALAMVPLVRAGYAGKKLIWAWNILGFVLLLNILTIAISTQPRKGYEGPPNTLPFQWPSIWIIFCVFIAMTGHLITFRRLLRKQQY